MHNFSKLQELAEAAGGVRWEWWTSNSTLRLTTEVEGRSGADGDVISAYQSSVECPLKYRDLIAAANPAVVLALLAEIERLNDEIAEPEWDAMITKLEDANVILRSENETLRARTTIDKEAARWRMRELLPGVPGDMIDHALFACINEAMREDSDHANEA
ncbi:ead/Ea22-like family protein [Pseudomonas sp. 10B1]|uniref:ead/Ea22-like family protein n=1 Tax=unclassified Pseudomonas TaxID=196821 RepID=UPI002B221D0A|nr:MULTISPECIES: ead/Ea22-like family protein [unclassified Pseudomonas]MEA9994285.1 ead/Ea22-like family protein [Pseudomonas sp. AA4]MEB0088538.1 ead/Ea22-like family protein [Pseudomonas sp. RTI1]MEB0126539.1 ead/Ea22-like family protein [Pseudomonas sp. CCC1.2]MEB0154648.1 ead/Ea22-like family protein [Pseudomonas sp. CCC4.3]MEB0221135.1 ead/Ea22-like family protein [Pseudomonas sp. AB12(2023)]